MGRIGVVTWLLGLMWLLSAATNVSATEEIIYVKSGANGSGADWSDAADLQSALTAAIAGDEVWVAGGIYLPGNHQESTFELRNRVVLYGGFAGTPGTEGDVSARDWENNPSVLSGDIDDDDTFKTPGGVVTDTMGITGNNVYHVVTGRDVSAETVLDGFYITAGNATGSSADARGGGLYNELGSPTLNNIIFSGNYALRYGGGMANFQESNPRLTGVTFRGNRANKGGGMANYEHSSPILSDVTFEENQADEYGGGLFNRELSSPQLDNVDFVSNHAVEEGGGMFNNDRCRPTLTDVDFVLNRARNGGGMSNFDDSTPSLIGGSLFRNSALERGGGMHNYQSDSTLTTVQIDGNHAGWEGGGIYNDYSNPTLTKTSFSNNESGSQGGGIYNIYADPILVNVTLKRNRAPNNGGGMVNYRSSPSLTGGVFEFNSAGGDGGGIYNDESSPTITRTRFWANSAGLGGGGIANNHSNPTLIDVTIAYNQAGVNGGGLHNHQSSPTITRTKFWSNSAGLSGGGIYNDASSPILTNLAFGANRAGESGGGIDNRNYSHTTLTQVIFVCNQAGKEGGGIRNWANSDPTLTNVTVVRNSATETGGGIHNGDYSTPLVQNSLVWDNTAPTGSSLFNNNSTPTVRYSLIESGLSPGTVDGGGNLDGTDAANDPLFVRLPDSCDEDSSYPGDNLYGDLRLQGTSPAIDAGDSGADLDGSGAGTTTIADVPWDYAFQQRIRGAAVDLGVYEEPPILYVRQGATGAATGASWTDALPSLQDALDLAVPNQELWVATGVYLPGNSQSSGFSLKDYVALYGGFAGAPGSEGDASARDWIANPTVLSGDIDDNDDLKTSAGVVTDASGITGINTCSVVYAPEINASAILDGFYVTAGNMSADLGCCEVCCGGGLLNSLGSPTLTNVAFSGNYAEEGGGMCNIGGHPTLTHVTFSGNEAHVNGAGMQNGRSEYNGYSNPTLTNVLFRGNRAGNSGGGMYNRLGRLSTTNVLFSGNHADFYGGGMVNDEGGPILTNVTFCANHAGTQGGGIYNTGHSYSPLVVQNAILWGNSAPNDPNIFNDGSSPTVRYSLVQGGLPAGSVDGGGNLGGNVNPRFAELPNSGDGDWATPGDNDYGNLRLSHISTAIDRGDNGADLDGSGDGSTTIADVAVDLADRPRIVAVTGPAPTVDLGAYERPNTPPAFSSSPPLVATVGNLYSYAITSSDANQPGGSGLLLTLLNGPGWLVFTDNGDGTGSLSGTPAVGDVGDHPLTLQVEDPGGRKTEQSFTVTVSGVAPPPPPNGSLAGQVTQNGAGVAGVTVTANSQGTAHAVTASAVASQTVTDAAGYYRIDNLAPGAYTLTFAPPFGYAVPDPVDVAVVAGQVADVPSVALVPGNTEPEQKLYLPFISS